MQENPNEFNWVNFFSSMAKSSLISYPTQRKIVPALLNESPTASSVKQMFFTQSASFVSTFAHDSIHQGYPPSRESILGACAGVILYSAISSFLTSNIGDPAVASLIAAEAVALLAYVLNSNFSNANVGQNIRRPN